MRGAFESIIVKRRSGAVIDEVGEGIWTSSFEDTTYLGSIHQSFSEEAQTGELGKYGERQIVILRMPLKTVVTNNDIIELSGYNEHINGTYTIEGMRWTKTHLRIEARRTITNE